jgi:putative Mg2+ transporter-C (MgtC) family protein
MEFVWQDITRGIDDPRALSVGVRIIAAMIFGALIGYEREDAGKSAGIRTHILVTLGSAMFVIAGSVYGMSSDGLSRIIQGIVTGIGFIGAGSILKLTKESHVRGLTTSAGIWMAAAIGITVGLGALGIAFAATLITFLILRILAPLKHIVGDEYDDADVAENSE